MASGEDTVITTQPRLTRKELQQFVEDLDPLQVVEWASQDVVDNYLKPTNMEHMAKAFLENNIDGAALLALEESHLKELDCANVGDRISFLEFLKLLKKHKRDADRSRALWCGTTPVCSLAYHRNCASFCFQVFCRCCVATKEWRVTGQGIRWKNNRAPVDCCGTIKTEFIDYRFVKDTALQREPKCCCCCIGTELLVYADDKDSVSTREVKSGVGGEPVSIMHPEAAKAESIIRNAWADARLVA